MLGVQQSTTSADGKYMYPKSLLVNRLVDLIVYFCHSTCDPISNPAAFLNDKECMIHRSRADARTKFLWYDEALLEPAVETMKKTTVVKGTHGALYIPSQA